MGKISIFNYEIFYLDYLEGRLGEDDVRMLMEFFEGHPECRLDDPELPVLSLDDDIVFKGKNDLKQTDDNEAITTENVEHFMISEAENILSDEKREELNQLVEGNTTLEKERKRYSAVYFAPDTSVVFQNKESLKQRKTIVLWPYIAAGIAAAIISFVFLMNGGDETGIGNIDGPAIADQPNKLTPKVDPKSPDNNTIVVENEPVQIQTAGLENVFGQTPNESESADDFTPLSTKKPRLLSFALNKDPEPITKNLGEKPKTFSNNEQELIHADINPSPTQVIANAMSNPIEPITSFVSKKTNTNVDFQTRKATEDKKGGFFFKVGKFEFSRNKH